MVVAVVAAVAVVVVATATDRRWSSERRTRINRTRAPVFLCARAVCQSACLPVTFTHRIVRTGPLVHPPQARTSTRTREESP
uniref:Putative secreted peptide n=1 Tax=Anopheles braziliensis TaxID=58242 RepID=A0A2M3ZQN7_9DIPT